MDSLRTPEEIYRLSFARVRRVTRLDHLPPSLRPLAIRMVHACGLPEITADLDWREDPAAAARRALDAGAAILCDTAMTEAGILKRLLPAGSRTICTLSHAEVPQLAEKLGTTRAAAAVELWRPWLDGAVIAIGNAPTALQHLLERLKSWDFRPAAVFAFPVGFVGAVESKRALAAMPEPPPYLTLHGRFGGSALAASAINALLVPQPP